jgi:hypothetical protein
MSSPHRAYLLIWRVLRDGVWRLRLLGSLRGVWLEPYVLTEPLDVAYWSTSEPAHLQGLEARLDHCKPASMHSGPCNRMSRGAAGIGVLAGLPVNREQLGRWGQNQGSLPLCRLALRLIRVPSLAAVAAQYSAYAFRPVTVDCSA